MTQFLAIISLIRSLLPLIREAVDLLDAAMPPGTGKQKLDTLQAMLKQATETDSKAAPLFDVAWPMISALVAGIVAGRKVVPPAAVA